MGSGYRSNYTTRDFKLAYNKRKLAQGISKRHSANPQTGKNAAYKNSILSGIQNHLPSLPSVASHGFFGSLTGTNQTGSQDTPLLEDKKLLEDGTHDGDGGTTTPVQEPDFKYPFNELLIWAVLMKRQNMARCMWLHGEEAMAKALVACKLYKSLAKEAAEDYLEVEICEELRRYAEEFRKLALDLLEHCYQTDDDMTMQLLTYELKNWGQSNLHFTWCDIQ